MEDAVISAELSCGVDQGQLAQSTGVDILLVPGISTPESDTGSMPESDLDVSGVALKIDISAHAVSRFK